jgi:hypothetical protein
MSQLTEFSELGPPAIAFQGSPTIIPQKRQISRRKPRHLPLIVHDFSTFSFSWQRPYLIGLQESSSGEMGRSAMQKKRLQDFH